MLDNGDIDEETYNGLLPEDPKVGTFFLQPKIHKEGIPGRPIISGIDHPTEKISQFLDHHLQPHVENIPSYVKDTTDYLNKTSSEDLPSETILVTLDVTSLYTNIPHADGIEACRKIWDSRAVKVPSTESLVKLLE